TGLTTSGNFPTTPNAWDSTYAVGGIGLPAGDAFVTKLNLAPGPLVFSTYLGGAAQDEGYGVAIDSDGLVTVVGQTNSDSDVQTGSSASGFPTTPTAYYRYHTGVPGTNFASYDAFLTRFDPTGQSVQYSTYLSGSNWDRAKAVTVDAVGNPSVVGET